MLAGVLALLVAPGSALAAPFPGTFTTTTLDQGTVRSAVTADFNGDGRMDIATLDTSAFGNTVAVRLANSSFGYPVRQVATIANSGRVLRVADFNQDGKPDVLVSHEDNTAGTRIASVLVGKGDGTFSSELDFSVSGVNWTARAAAVGDLNQDGNPDFVIADDDPNVTTNNLAIYYGNGGAGGSLSFSGPTFISGGRAPEWAEIADVDGDGVNDIVLANSNDINSSVGVLRGKSGGAFNSLSSYPITGPPVGLVLGDLNGDGRKDVVTVSQGSANSVSVLLGTQTGFAPSVAYKVGTGPQAVAIADLNGDGNSDVVLTDASGMGELMGNGDGTLAARTTINGSVVGLSVAAADLNADGRTDLVSGNNSGTLELLNNTPTSVASAPASTTKRDLSVTYTTTGTAMDKIRLYVKTPARRPSRSARKRARPARAGSSPTRSRPTASTSSIRGWSTRPATRSSRPRRPTRRPRWRSPARSAPSTSRSVSRR